jgi:hypothetical protein
MAPGFAAQSSFVIDDDENDAGRDFLVRCVLRNLRKHPPSRSVKSR